MFHQVCWVTWFMQASSKSIRGNSFRSVDCYLLKEELYDLVHFMKLLLLQRQWQSEDGGLHLLRLEDSLWSQNSIIIVSSYFLLHVQFNEQLFVALLAFNASCMHIKGLRLIYQYLKKTNTLECQHILVPTISVYQLGRLFLCEDFVPNI